MTQESVFFAADEQEKEQQGGTPEETPTASTGRRSTKDQTKKFIEETYKEVASSLTDEERANLGSKSNTLKLVRVLGLGSKKDSRKVGGATGQMVECDKPVALELLTEIDIEVPVLPVTTNVKSDINFAEVQTRTVKAGEKFQVTYYEAMLLLIRDEYMGTFHANGQDNEAILSVNLPKYLGGDQKIPTPAFNFRNGAFKEDIHRMDTQLEDKTWVMQEEFIHYADFLKRQKSQRATGSATSRVSQQTKVALTLQKAFGIRK